MANPPPSTEEGEEVRLPFIESSRGPPRSDRSHRSAVARQESWSWACAQALEQRRSCATLDDADERCIAAGDMAGLSCVHSTAVY